jgi:arylsulfatase
MSHIDPEFCGIIGRTWRESTPSRPAPVRPPEGAPHLLFIVLDDVGFSDLGCYGSEIETPHMDRLAAGGLRYTNFHTTGVCSPTRACLLTGRNAHAVGMGSIAEWATGFPGYQGRVTKRAATLAEILRPRGYNCLAVGKWHLMPNYEATAAGPFDYWPLGRGFDRWYGFHGALTDQWHPELFEDNHPVDTPKRPGYHLSEDLADHAIAYVRDQQSVAPEKPFFLYLAFGACHWPHHAPRHLIEKYRGRFDCGWDTIREQRFARQRALGIVPLEAELAPRNPGVRAWADLSPEERRLSARLMEVYAAYLEHTDAEIGRVLAYLESIGRLDNTAVVLLSDNGATPEGGEWGAVNGRKHLMSEPETLADGLAALDRLGSDWAFNIYSTGWAQASNTPLKWYKKDTHGGGVRDPLLVRWPARIADPGGLRPQYHHAIDIVPTVLELLGVEAPTVYQGLEQVPIQGVSMAYSFREAAAPTRRQTQAYELLGDRAIWHQGWKAVAKHEKGVEFDQDRWELYHLDSDFSEYHDLAARHPEKLREMIERWWVEAAANDMLPLDDREFERAAANVAARARRTYTYYPGMARIDRLSAPDITDRSHRITADVEIPAGGAEGVLLTSGSRFAGYVLYLKDGHLIYEYAFSERDRYTIRSAIPVPEGRRALGFIFTKTGTRRGRGGLFIDGQSVGAVELPKTWPVITTAGGIHCGRDAGLPVTDAYTPPFLFTGTLHQVRVELSDDGRSDPAVEAKGALAEQ